MRVLQAGMDKSGNYWLWKILRLLMDEARVPRRSWIVNDPIYSVSRHWQLSFPEANELDVISWDTAPAIAYAGDDYATQPLRERSYYYCVIPMYRRRLENVAEYVAANSHLWTHAPWHDNLPAELLSGIDKIVYIVRDPRDVLVSGANYIDSDYCRREFGIPRIPLEARYARLVRTTCPEWAVHVAGWIGHARVVDLHIVSYESLLADLGTQLARLAAYLELDLSGDQLKRIEEQVVFKSMKSGDSGGHVRTGIAGNWRNVLPAEVAAQARAICQPLLELFGYEGSDGDLSPFLTRGEIAPSISAALDQINALQAGARNRLASTAPASGPRRAPPASTGWR